MVCRAVQHKYAFFSEFTTMCFSPISVCPIPCRRATSSQGVAEVGWQVPHNQQLLFFIDGKVDP